MDRRISTAFGRILLFAAIFPSLIGVAQATVAEPAPAVPPATTSDIEASYVRALAVINTKKNHSLLNFEILPNWIGDEDRFWYCRQTRVGCIYTVVDARTGAKSDLFDHEALARELRRLTGKDVPAADLQLQNLFVTSDRTITFNAFSNSYSYDRDGRLDQVGKADASAPVMSPDGSKAVFVRSYNLWVRNVKTGEERQLTDDGSELYAYALKPQTRRLGRPAMEAKWSSDSRSVLTVQTDDRLVKPLPLIEFVPADGQRPIVREDRVAFPGDSNVPTYRMVAIDVATGRQTKFHYPNIPAVRMLDTPIGGARAWWSGDNSRIYFVDIERGEKVVRLISADVKTGEARELFRESHPEGYVELGPNVYNATMVRILPARNQIIWYSERSGSPQLYLYDLNSGALIRKLTDGGNVQSVLAVDEAHDEAFISVSGRDPNKNPYYRDIVRIGLTDGTSQVLSSGDDDRVVADDGRAGDYGFRGAAGAGGFSASRNYWVETQARLDRLPRTLIRRRDGSEVAVVERGESHGLPEGFRWPEPVMLTAADGVTPIQALVARPSNFDPSKKYPIIDYVYGGPQVAVVPTSFDVIAVQAQELAELGFIAVMIDGRGTGGRDRAFREASYGSAQTASDLEDHIAGIRQLAARYPYIDLDRVGVNGFSAGGYMAASAMMRFPDFFKVGVAESGNHDQRTFWHSWGERYQGLLEGENYLAQANTTYVNQLKGKLLLIHGMMDMSVHPGNLFQFTQKLMDANKDFDLVILPKARHEPSGYSIRKRWDYFVRNLLRQEPPTDFRVSTDAEFAQEEGIRRNSSDKKSN